MTDEDDALVQVINHGSVHHAGFLSESTIFALSHDEQFSIHPATNPDDPGQEPEPVDFDDVREPLGVEYVVQVCMGGQGSYIAAGNKMYVIPIFLCSTLLRLLISLFCHSDKRLDLVPLVSSPSWHFDQDNLWRLPGAHGDEVVRSVYLDEQVCLFLSCSADQSTIQCNVADSFLLILFYRVNPSSLVARMDSCEFGSPMETIRRSRLDLPRLRGRRRNRKIGSGLIE